MTGSGSTKSLFAITVNLTIFRLERAETKLSFYSAAGTSSSLICGGASLLCGGTSLLTQLRRSRVADKSVFIIGLFLFCQHQHKLFCLELTWAKIAHTLRDESKQSSSSNLRCDCFSKRINDFSIKNKSVLHVRVKRIDDLVTKTTIGECN